MTTTIGAALRKIFRGPETLNLASFDTAPAPREPEDPQELARYAADLAERTKRLRERAAAQSYPVDAAHECTHCEGILLPRGPVHVDEGDGSAMVDLVCTNECGVTSAHYWTASDEQYEAAHGHPFGTDTEDGDDE